MPTLSWPGHREIRRWIRQPEEAEAWQSPRVIFPISFTEASTPTQPKSPERRQRRNKGGERRLSIVREFTEPPPPPKGLLKKTTLEWIAYFESTDSVLVKKNDLPILERMYWMRDERRRLERVVRSVRIEYVDDGEGGSKAVRVSNRFIPGSTGQIRLNPAYQEIAKLAAEERQLEDRFMANIRARLAGGAQFATTHRSLDELNRQAEEAEADGDDDTGSTEDDDPLASLLLPSPDQGGTAAS